jgi:hypothetical protein
MAAFMANPANASPTNITAIPSTIRNCVIVRSFNYCDLKVTMQIYCNIK